jgi:hypothetical protein
MADRKRPKYKAPLVSPESKKSVKKPKTPPSTMAKSKQTRVAERGKHRAPQQTAKRKKTDAAKRDIPPKKAAKKVVKKPVSRAQRVIVDPKNVNIMGGRKGSGKYYKAAAALAALVAAGTAAWQQTKPSFGSRMRSSIKSAEGSPKDKPRKHDPFTGYYGPLAPLETKEVKDTRAKKTGTRPTTGASGDGPGPPPPTPKSVSREKQRRDFAAYNKPGSKLGMKMDDILRGAFSFMGALPKSTAKDKWKNK